jgi:hypothetical protein
MALHAHVVIAMCTAGQPLFGDDTRCERSRGLLVSTRCDFSAMALAVRNVCAVSRRVAPRDGTGPTGKCCIVGKNSSAVRWPVCGTRWCATEASYLTAEILVSFLSKPSHDLASYYTSSCMLHETAEALRAYAPSRSVLAQKAVLKHKKTWV